FWFMGFVSGGTNTIAATNLLKPDLLKPDLLCNITSVHIYRKLAKNTNDFTIWAHIFYKDSSRVGNQKVFLDVHPLPFLLIFILFHVRQEIVIGLFAQGMGRLV
ncbi:hypothetical protein ACJX0J_006806, partial [Zea mays]